MNTYGYNIAWGWNDDGHCNVPGPNNDFVAVAGGGYHSLGIRGTSLDTNPPMSSSWYAQFREYMQNL